MTLLSPVASVALASLRSPGGEPRFPILLVVLSVLLCPFLIVMVPPSQVADEPAHILRAYGIGHGEWVGIRSLQRADDGNLHPAAGVTADPVLADIGGGMPNGSVYDSRRIDRVNRLPWTGTRRFFPVYTIATYAPLLYLPSALTLAAGERLGLTPLWAILAGRFVNAALFTVLGALALHVARKGRAILFCVLAVPMTLSLASSFNQDGLIIATSVLAASLLTLRENGRAETGLTWAEGGASVLLAVVTLAKPPYLPMLAALMIPWSGHCPRRLLTRRIGLAVFASLPALAWASYTTTNVATPILRAIYEAGCLWPGPRPAVFVTTDPAAQLQVLTAQPSLLAKLPLDLLHNYRWFLMSAIGMLGWVTLAFSKSFYRLWEIATFAAILSVHWGWTGARGPALRLLALALFGGAAALTLWAVAMSQYLSWTSVGYPQIEGPQGRYLLPVLPLLAVAVRPTVTGVMSRWRARAAWVPVIAAAANLIAVPMLILKTYTDGGSV